MNYDDLNPELIEKAKACTSAAELVALAKSEGIELSDDELEAVAGGDRSSTWDALVDCDGQACIGYNCPDYFLNCYRN